MINFWLSHYLDRYLKATWYDLGMGRYEFSRANLNWFSNVLNFLLIYHIQYEDLLSSKKKSESNDFLFFVSGMCVKLSKKISP